MSADSDHNIEEVDDALAGLLDAMGSGDNEEAVMTIIDQNREETTPQPPPLPAIPTPQVSSTIAHNNTIPSSASTLMTTTANLPPTPRTAITPSKPQGSGLYLLSTSSALPSSSSNGGTTIRSMEDGTSSAPFAQVLRDADSGILLQPPRSKVSIQLYLRDELPIVKRQRPFRPISAVNDMFSTGASSSSPSGGSGQLSVTTIGVVIHKAYSKQANGGGGSSMVAGRYNTSTNGGGAAEEEAGGGGGGATSGIVKIWSMKGFSNTRLPAPNNTFEENKHVLTCLLVGAAFTTYFTSLTAGDVVVFVNPQPFQSKGGFSSSSTFKLPLFKASTANDFVVIGRAMELGVCGHVSRHHQTGGTSPAPCAVHAHKNPGVVPGTRSSCAFHANAAAGAELRNAKQALKQPPTSTLQSNVLGVPQTLATRMAPVAPPRTSSTTTLLKPTTDPSKAQLSHSVNVSNMQEDFVQKVLMIQKEQKLKAEAFAQRHRGTGILATTVPQAPPLQIPLGKKRARSVSTEHNGSSSSTSSSTDSSTSASSCSSSSDDDDNGGTGTPRHHPQIEPEYHSPLGTEDATMEMFSPGGKTPRRGDLVGDDDDLSPHERHKRRMEAKAATEGGEVPASAGRIINPTTALFLPKSIVSAAGDKAAAAVLSRSQLAGTRAPITSRSAQAEEGFLKVRSGRLIAPSDDALRKRATQDNGGTSAAAQRLHDHRVGNSARLTPTTLAESSARRNDVHGGGSSSISTTAARNRMMPPVDNGPDMTSPLARLPDGLLRGSGTAPPSRQGAAATSSSSAPSLSTLNVTPRGQQILQAAVRQEANNARAKDADSFRKRELLSEMQRGGPSTIPSRAAPAGAAASSSSASSPSAADLAALRAFGNEGRGGSAFKPVGGYFTGAGGLQGQSSGVSSAVMLGEESTVSRIQRAMKGDFRTSAEVLKLQQDTINEQRASHTLASRGLSTGALGQPSSQSASSPRQSTVIEQVKSLQSRNGELVYAASVQQQAEKIARIVRVETAESALEDIWEIPGFKCVFCRTCDSHFPNIRGMCKANNHICEQSTTTKRFVECGQCKRYRMPVLSNKALPPFLVHMGCPKCKEVGYWLKCSSAPPEGGSRFTRQ